MSKKVIGIAVIAGLDLAFIILMQAGWAPPEVSQNIDPQDRYQRSLTQKQSLPELDRSLQVDSVEESNDAKFISVDASEHQIQKTASYERTPQTKRVRRSKTRSTALKVQEPMFTDTVIYIKRSEPFQFQQVSYVEPNIPVLEPIVEIKPEQKKKSFFSKAAPIVKKPYEWLKDLAEKLK